MKLFFMNGKKAACFLCFSLVALLTCVVVKNTCFAKKSFTRYDSSLESSEVDFVANRKKSIEVGGYIIADGKPTGAEIYRAQIDGSGKRGSFQKIGSCKRLKADKYFHGKWRFSYKDSEVEGGQEYVYRCRAYSKVGKIKKFQEKGFKAKRGVAGSPVGKYGCKIIKNEAGTLVVQLTGKSRYNGALEGYMDDLHSYSVFLLCKNQQSRIKGDTLQRSGGLNQKRNKEKKEIVKSLAPEAYSYDGKKWHYKRSFRIQGKESIYLRFQGKNLKVSGYQQIQMMMGYMRYNLCQWSVDSTKMSYLRFNLVSNRAWVGDFLKWDSNKKSWLTRWDGDTFDFDIFAAGNTAALLYCNISSTNCARKDIMVSGDVRAEEKPSGVEIYRADIKGSGKRGKFKRIGTCKEYVQVHKFQGWGEWEFVYKDHTVKTGHAYAYRAKPFNKTENTKQFCSHASNIKEGFAGNTVGKYKCRVVRSTRDKLIIKIAGTSAQNGPLGCYVDSRHKYCQKVHLVYRNEGEAEIVRILKPQAYSYDGKNWYAKPLFSIKGEEGIYLRFVSESGEDINVAGYQYVQMMMEFMKYNLCPLHETGMPQLRANLITGKALVDDFIYFYSGEDYWTEWDGDEFEYDIYIEERSWD